MVLDKKVIDELKRDLDRQKKDLDTVYEIHLEIIEELKKVAKEGSDIFSHYNHSVIYGYEGISIIYIPAEDTPLGDTYHIDYLRVRNNLILLAYTTFNNIMNDIELKLSIVDKKDIIKLCVLYLTAMTVDDIQRANAFRRELEESE